MSRENNKDCYDNTMETCCTYNGTLVQKICPKDKCGTTVSWPCKP